MPAQHQRRKQVAPPLPARSPFAARKGKLAGSIIAMSSAAIISIYTIGRVNTNAAFDQITGGAPPAAVAAAPASPGAAVAAPTAPSAGGVATAPTAAASSSTAAYKDGTYVGSGSSRHGGMEVTVIIQGGQITSANVTSCGTRYPCSDVDSLVRSTVSQQNVPANHVSGASDSSKAYKQAVSDALNQAKA